MDFKEVIAQYKDKTGSNDSDIARFIGVSRSTVSRWMNGESKNVSPEVIKRVSAMIGHNIAPILKGIKVSTQLPVLGYVKGGYDLFAEENYLGYEDIALDEAIKGDYFLKVTGNSMNGFGIMDGSIVLVRKTDHLASGDIGIVLVGEEVTIKRVVYKQRMMILESGNPEIENKYFTAKEVKDLPVQVIGRALSVKTYL